MNTTWIFLKKKVYFEEIEWFRENRQMTDYSLNSLYEVTGITNQDFWNHFRREKAELELIEWVIGDVDKRRKKHPGEGLEKLYDQLNPQGLGRDKNFTKADFIDVSIH